MENTNLCPVCGYNLGFRPWNNDSASDEICPCCGIQFGYDDVAGGNKDGRKYLYLGWRLKWRKDGMKFSHPAKELDRPPTDWDPKVQLKNVE